MESVSDFRQNDFCHRLLDCLTKPASRDLGEEFTALPGGSKPRRYGLPRPRRHRSSLRTEVPERNSLPGVSSVPRTGGGERPSLKSEPSSRGKARLARSYRSLTPGLFVATLWLVVTWDEQKRQANLRSHGLDFEGCEAVFDHPVLTKEDSRMAYGEQRINLLGWLRDGVVHMTYTERGEDLHVISLREATKHEVRYYFKAISNEA